MNESKSAVRRECVFWHTTNIQDVDHHGKNASYLPRQRLWHLVSAGLRVLQLPRGSEPARERPRLRGPARHLAGCIAVGRGSYLDDFLDFLDDVLVDGVEDSIRVMPLSHLATVSGGL